MMRTLVDIKYTGTISFNSEKLLERPDLAAHIAVISTIWTHIETEIGLILAAMLGDEQKHAITIYSSLVSGPPRASAIKSIGETILNPTDQKLLEALLKKFRAVAAKRNNVIHGIWGVPSSVDDALVYVDPIKNLKHKAFLETYFSLGTSHNVKKQIETHHDAFVFYYKADFASIIETIKKLLSSLRTFKDDIVITYHL